MGLVMLQERRPGFSSVMRLACACTSRCRSCNPLETAFSFMPWSVGVGRLTTSFPYLGGGIVVSTRRSTRNRVGSVLHFLRCISPWGGPLSWALSGVVMQRWALTSLAHLFPYLYMRRSNRKFIYIYKVFFSICIKHLPY